MRLKDLEYDPLEVVSANFEISTINPERLANDVTYDCIIKTKKHKVTWPTNKDRLLTQLSFHALLLMNGGFSVKRPRLTYRACMLMYYNHYHHNAPI